MSDLFPTSKRPEDHQAVEVYTVLHMSSQGKARREMCHQGEA